MSKVVRRRVAFVLLVFCLVMGFSSMTLAAETKSTGSTKTSESTKESEPEPKSEDTKTSEALKAAKIDEDSIYAIYKVNYSYLNIRKSYSTKSKLLGKLDKGDRVEVTEIKNRFAKIKTTDGTAWVSTQYLKRVKDGWVKKNGTWQWYRSDLKKTVSSNSCYQAYKDNMKMKSKTEHLIIIDKKPYKLYVFEMKNERWVPRLSASCKIGMAGHETPTGTFEILSKKSYFDKNGHTYRYCTRFSGRRYIHSTAFQYHSKTVLERRVGFKGTHGCVGIVPEFAKWIYKNCKIGTKVICY